MDHTDGGGSSKPAQPPGGTDQYQKGHEGYKRWYGQPGQLADPSAKHTEQAKQPSTDHYYKGHEGYKKHYGNPGPPTTHPATTAHTMDK